MGKEATVKLLLCSGKECEKSRKRTLRDSIDGDWCEVEDKVWSVARLYSNRKRDHNEFSGSLATMFQPSGLPWTWLNVIRRTLTPAGTSVFISPLNKVEQLHRNKVLSVSKILIQ